jgi:hypothetical protein
MNEDCKKFLDYISALPVEGETALLLKQKLTLDSEGNVQYHADGAPVATFPAFLPSKAKIKDGDAWYVNTGAFIMDRFENGKPVAQRRCIDFVLFMMLDDIGTKSKVPPLAPTWIMETSEGSFQWGYAFSDQPTKDQFTAAIKAIAAAGYTDPGATNAVRNCRLPSSVNLKRGRNNFRAHLVEFHPDREYTLAQICDALGVVPEEADSAEFDKIRLKDTGNDSVVHWMNDHGMLLAPPNHEGWMGVVCPNKDAHSDGNPEARYHPVNRAFVCYHGHCNDFSSQMFLDWVAENGGPKVEYGVRDDLLVERMNALYEKIEPTERFPDAAAAIVDKVERQQAGRVEKSQWFSRYAYIQSDDAYFDLEKRDEIARNSFNALYRHVECRSVHNSKMRVQASVCFDENREAMNARVVAGLTYAAGDSVFVARENNIYANRWRDARPDVSGAAGDVTPWLEHCRALVPNDDELEHIFNVMAFKVQNPSVKINHAVLHGGYERSGKDTMWYPFMWAICGPDLRNYSVVDNDNLASVWGYNYETEVMVLNELREPEAKERRALANKLKPVIAAPPDVLQVNRKGLHPYYMANRFFVLAFTNDQAPLSLPSQDRRWFCVWSRNGQMDEDRAIALWAWYKEQDGLASVAAWLHARDVSKFNPKAPPMETDFKRSLVENSRSTAEAFLVDMIQERKYCFAAGAIATPLHNYMQELQTYVPSSVKIVQAAILHALQEAGWVDKGRCSSSQYTSPKHVYCAPEYQEYSKSELRRMVEPVTGANIVDIRAKLK